MALGVDPKELIGFKTSPVTEELPPKAIRRRLHIFARLPDENQQYIAETVDMLVERRGLNHLKTIDLLSGITNLLLIYFR